MPRNKCRHVLVLNHLHSVSFRWAFRLLLDLAWGGMGGLAHGELLTAHGLSAVWPASWPPSLDGLAGYEFLEFEEKHPPASETTDSSCPGRTSIAPRRGSRWPGTDCLVQEDGRLAQGESLLAQVSPHGQA